MISLLSPAKSLDFSVNGQSLPDKLPLFLNEAEILIGKLKQLKPTRLQKLMKINKDLAEMNYHRNQEWSRDYLTSHKRTAIYAFNGEVYRGLQAREFDEADLKFADNHIGILSGLYGFLKPLDLIQPYRLEMGTKLKISKKFQNLYQFWNDKISNHLNEALESHESKIILNLASNEYIKSVRQDVLEYPLINCQFLDLKGESYKPIMTWAKHARGMMARKIVKERLDEPESLKKLSINGYKFNRQMSDDLNFVFTRKAPTG